MPIFEYECLRPGCSGTKEVIEPFRGDSYGPGRITIHYCECGHSMVRKISLSTFRLKGEGWGKDNYQGGPNAAAR